MSNFTTRLNTMLDDNMFIKIVEGGLDVLTRCGRLHWKLTDEQKVRVIEVLEADLQSNDK